MMHTHVFIMQQQLCSNNEALTTNEAGESIAIKWGENRIKKNNE